MPAYSTEDVACMRSYLDWLDSRDKTLRAPSIYTGGDLPENWLECLQINYADPHAMGLFSYVVYLHGFQYRQACLPVNALN